MNPLYYICAKTLVTKYIKETSNVKIQNIVGPIMPISIHILNKCTKEDTRGYYTLLKQAECNDHTQKSVKKIFKIENLILEKTLAYALNSQVSI